MSMGVERASTVQSSLRWDRQDGFTLPQECSLLRALALQTLQGSRLIAGLHIWRAVEKRHGLRLFPFCTAPLGASWLWVCLGLP